MGNELNKKTKSSIFSINREIELFNTGTFSIVNKIC